MELDIDAAALLVVGERRYMRAPAAGVDLAVAGLLIGHALGIVHGVGQDAAAALVDEECPQCDGGAANGEAGVQLDR
mgnify:CR=1 FL=1